MSRRPLGPAPRWMTVTWITLAVVPPLVMVFLLLTPMGQAICAAIRARS